MADNRETIDLVFSYDSASIGAATAGVQQFSDQVERLGAEAKATADAEKKLGDEGQRAGEKLGGAKASVGDMTQSITHLTRAWQDFYFAGLAGISNNIEEIQRSFGTLASAGIGNVVKALTGPAGVLVAMQAITLFGPKLLELFNSFLTGAEAVNHFADRLDELKNRLKEIEEKKVKVQIDYQQMEVLREQIKQMEKARNDLAGLLGKQTEAESEAGKRVSEAIVETPGGQAALERIIAEEQDAARRGEGKFGTKVAATIAEIERLRKLRDRLGAMIGAGGPGTESLQGEWAGALDKIRAAEDRLGLERDAADKEARQKIADIQEQAISGKGAEQAKALEQLARQLAARGGQAGAEAAEQIRGAPSARQRREWEAQGVKTANEIERRMREREEAEKERRRALEAQGVRNADEIERKRREREEAERKRRAEEIDRENQRKIGATTAAFSGFTPRIQTELAAGAVPEAVARQVADLMRGQHVDPKIASRAAGELVAKAAQELKTTYNRFFAASGDSDLAAFNTMQELAQAQMTAAANQRAMAAGFRSLRDEVRATHQQLRNVTKPFQVFGGRP